MSLPIDEEAGGLRAATCLSDLTTEVVPITHIAGEGFGSTLHCRSTPHVRGGRPNVSVVLAIYNVIPRP